MLDHAGFAIVEGGICTTLRDLARFGLLCLDDGRIGGEQLVPADWIARVCVRDAGLIEAFRASDMADPTRPDAFYHDKWWVFDGPRGVYTALGHERPVDPRPPAVADGDREVLDVRRTRSTGTASRSTTRGWSPCASTSREPG